MTVPAIPDGYPSVTPYLIVQGAVEAIDFYRRAFGAEETLRLELPDGKLAHAEVRIGDSPVMLADEVPDWGFLASPSLGGTAVGLLIYVEDVDAAFRRAVDAGAEVMRAVEDQVHGDRSGMLTDPFGHMWTLATQVEEVHPEEMQRRMAAMFEGADD